MTHTRPDLIDDYRLGDRLGAGGFGEVFRARHAVLDRDVAIKILDAAHCRDAAAVARFVVEARAANQIEHPGIVNVYGFGVLPDGRHYCVMELLRGRTLRALLDERRCLSLDEARPIFERLAAAIDAAHAAGVVHRDIKPENLFIEPDGSIRIIDFGLAKLATEGSASTTGHIVGSPRYMSPEQCRGKHVDARSDLYSFGAVVYHTLVGAPPFVGDALALALHHLNDGPEPPSQRVSGLPAGVDNVVLGLLAKDPAQRPRPLVAAVARLGETEAAPARPRAPRISPLWSLASVVAIAGATTLALAISPTSISPAAGNVARPSEPTYSIRELRSPGSVGYGIVNDGSLLYVGEGAPRRMSLETGKVSDAPADRALVGKLADGRDVVSLETGQLVAVDPRGARQNLMVASQASVSPDGRMIAGVGDGWLVVYDPSTQITRKVVELPPSAADLPRWSPNGQLLMWFDISSLQVRLTRVADGVTRSLTVPLLSEISIFAPVDFVDDDHIVYCANEDERRTIRVRTTGAIGDAGRVIAELDPGVAGCTISTTKGRLVVQVQYGRSELTRLALDRAKPELEVVLSGKFVIPIENSSLGDRVIAFQPATPGRVAQSERWLDISVRSGTISKLEPCALVPHAGAMQASNSLGWYSIDRGVVGPAEPPSSAAISAGSTLHLYDDHCAKTGEWKLPAAELSAPRCRGATCAIAGIVANELVVWQLVSGHPARELGRGDGKARIRSVQLALSPDGSRIVTIAGEGTAPQVFSTTSAKVRTISVPGAVQGVMWGTDPAHFIVTGMGIDEAPYAVVAVGLDGNRKVLWKSNDSWFYGRGNSSTDHLVGVAKRMRQRLLVFDPVAPASR